MSRDQGEEFSLDYCSRIFVTYRVEIQMKVELKCNQSLCYSISVKQISMLLFCRLHLMQHFSKYQTCEKIETMMYWRAEHGQLQPQQSSLSTKDKPEALAGNLVKENTALQSIGLLETVILSECGSQSPK